MSPATLTDLLHARHDSARRLVVVEGQERTRTLDYRSLHARAAARWSVLHARGARAGQALIILTEDRIAFVELFWAATLGGLVPVPVAGGISDEHRAKLYRIAALLDGPWLATDAATAERLERFVQADPEAVPGDVAAALRRATCLIDVGVPDGGTDPGTGAGSAVGSGADSGADSGAPIAPVHVAREHDIALIQFSSGSTSAPKGVVLTHRNLLTNLDGILQGMALTADDVMLSWMPLTHDMGLIGFHLTPLIGDIDQVLMPTDVFVRRPALWLTSASEYRASVLCSPNFGYEHLLKSFRPERLDGIDLSAVRLVFNGAEPISAALVERFNVALAPFGLSPVAMFPVYGLAEATLAVAFPQIGAPVQVRALSRAALGIGMRVESDADGAHLVAVGRPIPHVRVRIAAADGTPLPAGRVGRLLIRGDNVTGGYLGAAGIDGPRDTAAIDADGWLDTGDLAVELADQLYITGRVKDLVFVNGQNLYPHDLEQALQASGQVEPGRIAIAAVPTGDPARDRLVAFVQHRGEPSDVRGLRERLRAELARRTAVVLDEVVPVARLPKTTSGKVQRFALVRALQAGEFDAARQALGPMPALQDGSDAVPPAPPGPPGRPGDTVEQRLLALCRQRIEGGTLGVSDNLFELGISSLTLAEIHADIETVWPDVLDITDLFDYPSVEEIAGVLRERTGQA